MSDIMARAKAFEVAQYSTDPFISHIVTGNPEIAISAVDVDTDTFTSVGHGLSDGDVIYPIPNWDAGNIFAIDKYPTGLEFATWQKYRVKKLTNDTFKIATTADLLTILDITANANMDLTKWHFEKFVSDPSINAFKDYSACRVVMRGKTLSNNSGSYILPFGMIARPEWINPVSASFTYPAIVCKADIYFKIEAVIDYHSFLTIRATGGYCYSKNKTENAMASVNSIFCTPKYMEGSISGISLTSFNLANGSTIEVYKT